uniref:ISL LIM homeobox 1 n=1 Tax=Pavo cristatus TaxID=9049 RepID=A0A8C9FJM8_PAVCR
IGFSKNDFVMRARAKVYHIECFRCVACSRQLIPGDEFALREDGLFCRADHDVVERASLGAGDPLSPLHPARPLQMAGTARARRPAGDPRPRTWYYLSSGLWFRGYMNQLRSRRTKPVWMQSRKKNIQGMTGTPMVAASPERHDGGLQANPVEVQSYQPPWKVLSDFALQSDIDQPAFQQLVNFSEGGPGSNSTGSEVASMSSQLPDTPNSMVASPIEA